ncbi:hypothetical protein OVY01_05050 [Robbsia sp. Bb-Pol-6]|uniref:N-acetyltransferase domain-containing protein n=1 Tax=Robbsia betulipollinis TaxID=2981849 RepID=A0ABT3ZJA2_9BURK|nr:hypothetical protein [Robbsia betulipollinis]MCY0386614.1 hypothetical protein [Robbsia betulipollinis]
MIVAPTVTLRAYRDNVVALNLYASLGFVEVSADSTEEVVFMQTRV